MTYYLEGPQGELLLFGHGALRDSVEEVFADSGDLWELLFAFVSGVLGSC